MATEMILVVISIFFILILLLIRKFNFAYAGGESRILKALDKKILSFWNWMGRVYRESINDVIELIKDLPHIFLQVLNKIFYKLYKRTKRLINLIKGRKVPTNKGSVSLYLKSIDKKE